MDTTSADRHRAPWRALLWPLLATLAALAVVTGALLLTGHTTPKDRPDQARELTGLVNQRRADLGLAPLATDPALSALAGDWASHLARTGDLAHRDRLGAAAWDRGARFANVGENVGVGSSPGELLDAFVASTAHRENLDDPTWTRIGVGVHADADGRIWVAVNFADDPAG